MAQLDGKQIESLASKAQDGNGCALQAQFVNLDLSEQLKAMHDMREAYARQTGTDVAASKLSLTALQIMSQSNGDTLELTVGYNKRPPLFKAAVNLDNGKVQYSCGDTK